MKRCYTLTLSQIGAMTNEDARSYLESIRWPEGPTCPHCLSEEVTRLEGKAHRPGVFKCRSCRQQFTVTVGTIFESSHIPLQKWIMAFHLLCSSKKGMSSLQLQRELGLGSYRTALFMTHRIREAMNGPLAEAMTGTVEMDETYIGGKPRPNDGKVHKHGRGTSKVPVVAVVERNGKSKAVPVDRVTRNALTEVACENLDASASLITDELNHYESVGKRFRRHEYISHKTDEYVRYENGEAFHTNTAESFFSLMKRGHYGTYHKMSRKHLSRYCEEFAFRWNHRRTSDAARTVDALRGSAGKRLTYRQMVGK